MLKFSAITLTAGVYEVPCGIRGMSVSPSAFGTTFDISDPQGNVQTGVDVTWSLPTPGPWKSKNPNKITITTTGTVWISVFY